MYSNVHRFFYCFSGGTEDNGYKRMVYADNFRKISNIIKKFGKSREQVENKLVII